MERLSQECDADSLKDGIPYLHFDYTSLKRCPCFLCKKIRKIRRRASSSSEENSRDRWEFRFRLFCELSFLVWYDQRNTRILDEIWDRVILKEEWSDSWKTATLQEILTFFQEIRSFSVEKTV